jgi:hypothetical protein
MGRGKAYAYSLCLKRGHIREYCLEFGYNRKFGPINDNLDFGNVHDKRITLPPRKQEYARMVQNPLLDDPSREPHLTLGCYVSTRAVKKWCLI